jgi:hypothetical protein
MQKHLPYFGFTATRNPVLSKLHNKTAEVFLLFLSVVLFPASAAHGDEFYLSGESDILENPSVVTGFNKATNVLTGSISAIRTAPGRTDECRILFSGIVKAPTSISARFLEKDAADEGQSVSRVEKAAVVQERSLEADPR